MTQKINGELKVFIQLRQPSNDEVSEPRPFIFYSANSGKSGKQ